MTYRSPYLAQPPHPGVVQRTNPLAIAALVCGIAQFAIGLTFIPAIICGHMARNQIRRTGEQGDGMALAGLILGYIGAVLFVIVLVIIIGVAQHISHSAPSGP
jgi:Domain of unknown function (DUF4190)